VSERDFEKYRVRGAYHWREYYGGLAGMNAYTRGRYEMVVRCLESLSLEHGATILDMGCGDGALAGVIHDRLGLAVAGVDTSTLGIEFAQREFGRRALAGEFRVVEGYDTGFADGAFAAAVCSDVIEHVREPGAMLRELHRVLRPGGHLVLTTPLRFSEAPVDPMHVQEWFHGEFVELCRPVFGAPVAAFRSHPVLWYELVTTRRRWLNRAGRLAANALTLAGRNPFVEHDGRWRCYTTQTLVLARAAGATS
jgi:2-polyprenyl-3-methyl-5-hydroxy-6-metoxy-1,4-benzoquinol methylase